MKLTYEATYHYKDRSEKGTIQEYGAITPWNAAWWQVRQLAEMPIGVQLVCKSEERTRHDYRRVNVERTGWLVSRSTLLEEPNSIWLYRAVMESRTYILHMTLNEVHAFMHNIAQTKQDQRPFRFAYEVSIIDDFMNFPPKLLTGFVDGPEEVHEHNWCTFRRSHYPVNYTCACGAVREAYGFEGILTDYRQQKEFQCP